MTGPIPLDLVTAARGELRRTAGALAEAGVPAAVILDDAREGIADVASAHSRSGR